MNGNSVQIFVDSGSTHNFIQERVARFLELSIETIPSFSVVVGSGQRLRDGVSRQISVLIHSTTLVVDLYVLSYIVSTLFLEFLGWLH